MERRAWIPDGTAAELRTRSTGTSERQLRTSDSRHHVLHQLYHHQLHDRHQHVHSHYTGELQPSAPRGRDRHSGRRPRNVLHTVVQVRTTSYSKPCFLFSPKQKSSKSNKISSLANHTNYYSKLMVAEFQRGNCSYYLYVSILIKREIKCGFFLDFLNQITVLHIINCNKCIDDFCMVEIWNNSNHIWWCPIFMPYL